MCHKRVLRITMDYQSASLFTLGKHTAHRSLKQRFSTEVKIQVSKTSISQMITIWRYCKKLYNRLMWSFNFLACSHISPHILDLHICLLHNFWTVFELHHSLPTCFLSLPISSDSLIHIASRKSNLFISVALKYC